MKAILIFISVLILYKDLCFAQTKLHLQKTITPVPLQQNFNVKALTFKNDYFYISDDNQKNIFKFDSNGKLILSFKNTFNNYSMATAPANIIIDDSLKIYTCNPEENSIAVFNNSGDFIKSFGEFGYKNAELNEPVGIELSDNGSIFVLEKLNHRIQKFDKHFNASLTFGNFGLGLRSLYFPQSMALNNSNELLIIDKTMEQIKFFDYFGNFLKSINIKLDKSFPYQIETDSKDNIYILNTMKPEIFIYNPDGSLLFASTLNLNPPVRIYIDDLIYLAESCPLKINIFSFD